MPRLSFAIVVALLFSPYVIAVPGRRKITGSQPPTIPGTSSGTSHPAGHVALGNTAPPGPSVPGDHGGQRSGQGAVSTSDTPRTSKGKGKEKEKEETTSEGEESRGTTPPGSQKGSNDGSLPSTDSGGLQIGKEHRGMALARPKHYDIRHDEQGNPIPLHKNIRNRPHPAYVLGNVEDPNVDEVHFAPMTHDPKDNPKFVPGPATDIVSGRKISPTSQIHKGVPFRTATSNIKFDPPLDPEDYHVGKKQHNELVRSARHAKQQADQELRTAGPSTIDERVHPPPTHGTYGGHHGGPPAQHAASANRQGEAGRDPAESSSQPSIPRHPPTHRPQSRHRGGPPPQPAAGAYLQGEARPGRAGPHSPTRGTQRGHRGGPPPQPAPGTYLQGEAGRDAGRYPPTQGTQSGQRRGPPAQHPAGAYSQGEAGRDQAGSSRHPPYDTQGGQRRGQPAQPPPGAYPQGGVGRDQAGSSRHPPYGTQGGQHRGPPAGAYPQGGAGRDQAGSSHHPPYGGQPGQPPINVNRDEAARGRARGSSNSPARSGRARHRGY